MGITKKHHQNLSQLTSEYSFAPLGSQLSNLIKEALVLYKQDKFRQGTILNPAFVVWFVILSTIRRDLSYPAVINWMISNLRWVACALPKKLIAEGTLTKARQRLKLEVFQSIFKNAVNQVIIPADFYNFITVIFDGSTGRMPDTESNCLKFGKSKSGRGESAYPQVRILTLLAVSVRLILDVAYGPSLGKGTGERSLMKEIISKINHENLLILMDAGLYSFLIVWTLQVKKCDFIVKVTKNMHLPIMAQGRLSDGSYFCKIKGKIEVVGDSIKNRKKWESQSLIVRIIKYQIPGWRPGYLMTSILDTNISARELVIHYHKRWDIEICFDEIKTHQCATARGQMPTIFRSKKSELVEQELYGILIGYNLVRDLMCQAAYESDKDPINLSFLDSLQFFIEAVSIMSAAKLYQKKCQFKYLLDLISQSDIDRPRRDRINPRVVKIKMSKFKRKNPSHQSETRNLKRDLQILKPDAA